METTIKKNEFIHNGTKYSVFIQDGFNQTIMAKVYKNDENMLPVVGTTFAKKASFEHDIMKWAKRCVENNF